MRSGGHWWVGMLAVGLAALCAALPAQGAAPRDGWGFAIADDDWEWDNPGHLPSLGDRFADLAPKAFRFQMIWNAAELPWHMDRARAMIARARAQGVEEIVVTFKKSVGQDVDPVYGAQPTAEGYGARVGEVVRELADDVDVWGPANEPNRGETWLPGVPGAQRLAQYYATLESLVATWDPTARITSPDFVDRGDLGTIAAYVNAYKRAGGGWGDHVAWHPYSGLHNTTTQTTLDLIALAPPGAEVWITEAGAFGRSPGGVDDPPAVQNDKVWWLGTVLAELPQVTRIHYYHMRGNPGSAWDTGLTEVDGTRRPAWHTWCALARGLDHPACQPVTPPSALPPSPPPTPPPGPPPPTASGAAAIPPSPVAPLEAFAEPDPPRDATAPTVAIDRLPRRQRYAALRDGLSLRVASDEPSALKIELLVPRRAARGRLRQTVVAIRTLEDFSGARTVRLRPKAGRLPRTRPFVARVRVRATDRAGNRSTVVERLRVIRGRSSDAR